MPMEGYIRRFHFLIFFWLVVLPLFHLISFQSSLIQVISSILCFSRSFYWRVNKDSAKSAPRDRSPFVNILMGMGGVRIWL